MRTQETKTLTCMLLALLALPTVAGATEDTEKLIAKVAELTDGALVLVECKYGDPEGDADLTGVGVCYDAAKGDFLTFALGSRIRYEGIKDLHIVLPGFEGEKVPAEFLGARPEVGMAFVRAKEKRNWRAVRFEQDSGLKIGQVVVSAGLLPGARAHNPYFGLGYVSSLLRVPEQLYYVTGGRLTCAGSPVFAAGGQAVGMVFKTIYMDYQMPTARGASMVSMKGRQESAFFMPVEEFAFVLQNVPQGGQVPRPGWMGFLQALGISKQAAELRDLPTRAVTIDQVVPQGPAQKAGLRDGDVIVAVDGKPVEILSSPELTGRNLLRQIMLRRPGENIAVTVKRQGADSDVPMQLAKMPIMPEEATKYASGKLGFSVREKVPMDLYLDKSDTRKTAGLVVTAVAKGSPAESAGLKMGDVITAVNGDKVRTADVLRKAVDQATEAEPAQPTMLMVHRSGAEPRMITIKP